MSEPQNPISAPTFYLSVTGEERGLVGRWFGRSFAAMSKDDPETWIEALVAIDMHRQRVPDPQSRAHALTVGELQTWFADEDPEGADEVGEA